METYMQQPKLSSICLAVITSALLLTSTAGFATNYKGEASYKGEAMPAPCPQPLYLKDGFYVGVNALYDSYRTRVTRSNVLGTTSSSSTNVIASNGWGGGAFAGYGMYFNNLYYLAGEIFVDGSSASQSVSTTISTPGTIENFNAKASANASWGISVLPGLKLNDSTLGYIRLGYEGARLRGQQFANTNTGGGLSTYGSNSKWLSGFNYGVGMETAVYQNVSVRGEFNHTGYGSTNAGGASFNPSDNQYTLGLIYHFA
jgi:opacity protein-like surface antigen